MKVIHPFCISAEGYGLERNILCTLPGLVKQGIDTVALAVTEQRTGATVSEDFAARLDEANVRLVTTTVEGRLPFKLAKRFSAIFTREQPDIIHSHGYKCDLATLLATTGDAVRMTTVHGWCSRTAKERFYEWLNVQCCKRLDATVVFCEDYRGRLTRRGVPEERLFVVPVGLDTAVVPEDAVDYRQAWGLPPDAVVVAQIGRLSPEKQPEMFVRIAAALAPDFPEARFVLVGDGWMRDALAEQIRELGVSDRVLLAGYVHGMTNVLNALDLVVSCSKTEAMPRTLLEAGLAELPVVATAVGGSPDIVVDEVTGFIRPAEDEAGLREAMGELLENAERRRAMGRAALHHVQERFNTQTCSEALAKLYDALMFRRKEDA